MKQRIALLLCCLLVFIASAASACGTYVLIYDSDTRLLFEDEVRGYHYRTLGYILNEILARHGYHFDPDGEYYEHFSNLGYVYNHDSGFPYCEAPAEISNKDILASLSDIENKNIALIKKILDQKLEEHDESGFHVSWTCSETYDWVKPVGDASCSEVELPLNLRIPVYSGPGNHYLRENSGKAMVYTNDYIYAYGFDGDWLMITYLVNPDTSQTRVGYIHKDQFGRELNNPTCIEYSPSFCSVHDTVIEQLDFTDIPITLPSDTIITNDPTGALTPMASLKAGETVTLLAKFPADDDPSVSKETQWLYVEYSAQPPMRGFIPADLLE